MEIKELVRNLKDIRKSNQMTYWRIHKNFWARTYTVPIGNLSQEEINKITNSFTKNYISL
jgi:hypothetical protein